MRSAIMALAVAATVCAAVPTAAVAAETGTGERTLQSAVSRASGALRSRIEALRAEATTEPAAVSAATALLAASAGRVQNDADRVRLAAAIDTTKAATTTAVALLGQHGRLELPDANSSAAPSGDLQTLRHRLAELPASLGTSALVADTATVRADMSAWAAQQRAAAEQAAQRQAAAQQATQHRAAAASVTPAAVSGGDTLPVAGSASRASLQGMIDSCRGAVNGSGIYGVANFYMIRWSCGGSAIPRAAGATIVIGGVRYVSHGVVGTGVGGGSVTSIPRGYDAIVQTSGGGSEGSLWFFGLTRA